MGNWQRISGNQRMSRPRLAQGGKYPQRECPGGLPRTGPGIMDVSRPATSPRRISPSFARARSARKGVFSPGDTLDPLHEVSLLDDLCGPGEQENDGHEHQDIDPWRVYRITVQRRMEQVDEVRERGEGGQDKEPAGQLAERDEDPRDEDEGQADEA